MNRENRPLVTDELVESEEQPVEAWDFRKIPHHFRGISRIYLKLNEEKKEDRNMYYVDGWTWKKNTRILTDWFMPKNLPGHCWGDSRESRERELGICLGFRDTVTSIACPSVATLFGFPVAFVHYCIHYMILSHSALWLARSCELAVFTGLTILPTIGFFTGTSKFPYICLCIIVGLGLPELEY